MAPGATDPLESDAHLVFLDDDGETVTLDATGATSLLAATGGLDAATVSACPTCSSRVVAVVALLDLLEAAPPLPSTSALADLAADAPTLHLYVADLVTGCDHRGWRDPGHEEWDDAVELPDARGRGKR